MFTHAVMKASRLHVGTELVGSTCVVEKHVAPDVLPH